MAANLQSEPAARKRKMSHSDDNESLPSSHIDRKLQDTETELKDAENNKASYNGPQKVHVVMLRVANETSARPVPQSAFFSYDTALSFAMRILLQWCEAHYDDYHWKGPEVLTRHCVARYAAYNSQTGKQLAVADVIRVSIFDAKDAEAVPKENQTADLRECCSYKFRYAQELMILQRRPKSSGLRLNKLRWNSIPILST
ncbi:unnamed protein product [Aureobasidium pullulans]|nr:unnamed protein product [Aureobasidium pullulans]